MVLKNDHLYPGSKDRDVVVILYAEIGTADFVEWHRLLRDLADNGEITYILRHFVQVGRTKVLPVLDSCHAYLLEQSTFQMVLRSLTTCPSYVAGTFR